MNDAAQEDVGPPPVDSARLLRGAYTRILTVCAESRSASMMTWHD